MVDNLIKTFLSVNMLVKVYTEGLRDQCLIEGE